MTIGVYKILCLSSGNYYVGSSKVSVHGRWHGHRRSLREGSHHAKKLQAEFNKFGEKQFEFIVLRKMNKTATLKQIRAWESTFLKRALTAGKSLNGMPFVVEETGVYSEERRAFTIAQQKKLWSDPVYAANLLAARQVTIDSPEYKARMKGVSKRSWANPAKRLKQSKSQQKRWTAEARASCSVKMKEVLSSPEMRARLSKSAKKFMSKPEYRLATKKRSRAYWSKPSSRAKRTKLLRDPAYRTSRGWPELHGNWIKGGKYILRHLKPIRKPDPSQPSMQPI